MSRDICDELTRQYRVYLPRFVSLNSKYCVELLTVAFNTPSKYLHKYLSQSSIKSYNKPPRNISGIQDLGSESLRAANTNTSGVFISIIIRILPTH